MDQDQSPLLGKHHNGRSEEIQQESTSSKAAAASSSSEAVEVAAQTVKEMEVKYAAYMRHDMYGNWGMNSVPVLEKVKLLLALLTLCPIRFCLLLFFLVLFYLICKVCTLRVVASSNDEGQESFAHMTGARRAIVVRSGRFLARVMLFVFGFYNIHVDHRTPDRQLLHLGAAASSHERKDDEEEEEEEQFGAIVSNHVSYLDILYHMSASFPSFVAKRSVGKLPLVGLISKCLGCVYVQRESKSSDFKGVSALVSERLQAAYGDPTAPAVLLFPEGTTTNGEHLLPFKTGAFLAQTPVKPVILKYPYKRFSPAWDTISGFRHLVILMCQFVNHMEVIQLPVYSPSEKELTDPKLYANNVRAQMALEGNLTMSDIGLYEKRIFHSALLRTRFPIAPAPEESFTRTQSN
ncbi:unnamed protein product [Sphagnum jensenii]|uniref:Phospholipid/glycerol acyltransferase domain-containing protein n=1 Tax=Sphagnum jensenii TaxID=128206 RepID=A0ABP0XHJ4_9BRYO